MVGSAFGLVWEMHGSTRIIIVSSSACRSQKWVFGSQKWDWVTEVGLGPTSGTELQKWDCVPEVRLVSGEGTELLIKICALFSRF